MRILATADLHCDHAKSRPLALELIERINAMAGRGEFDALLLVGDTARGEGDHLEGALALLRFDGPKLFVAGNHELWTYSDDTYELLTQRLPRRVESAGWRWLAGHPYRGEGGVAVVGSVGWYDYSYAAPELGIARRFYEAKVSPGVAERLAQYRHLIRGDEPETALEVIARWNDGRHVRLGRDDRAFLDELNAQLDTDLSSVASARSVVCAVHHVPFTELLPPRHGVQWDFARAFLGSGAIGSAITEHPNVSHVLCGHSHYPAEANVGPIRAINIGSGYRQKRYVVIEA